MASYSIEDEPEKLSDIKPIQCVFVFRKPIFPSDRLIKFFAGQYVHMELLMFLPETPADSPTFTTFMGERFGMSISLKRFYNDDEYVGLLMDLNAEDAAHLLDYMTALTDAAVPYNFIDLTLQPIKRVLKTSPLFNDVESKNPRDFKKVFCSQAFTLATRDVIKDERFDRLVHALHRENSRLVTPMDFYHIIRPYCRTVDMDELRNLKLKLSLTWSTAWQKMSYQRRMTSSLSWKILQSWSTSSVSCLATHALTWFLTMCSILQQNHRKRMKGETSFPFLPTSTHESDLVPEMLQMCQPFRLLRDLVLALRLQVVYQCVNRLDLRGYVHDAVVHLDRPLLRVILALREVPLVLVVVTDDLEGLVAAVILELVVRAAAGTPLDDVLVNILVIARCMRDRAQI
ncbi:hypothetical protein GUITHDRAFT_149103 [Guillardia theta CCMP2712]|uniref:Uncharacterized protein n=1 Tax=Guillardia theta (strain CCMP2712) TaxID=905079 RepID=L1I792_GUITC|nr:hypothetical protein GUITHDRAFT_149103 [Guillardia theta CCMP2712]EKX31730.1 hypothetical protein GUITHDRAFT_149103 [Guillardia theta CCMP2712]|eukprot:XP_005818710.1 hypothetical protein GUITHDRAFT_149103 [Guillardia theta CCMP2712]